jgi:hypothetical protein
MRLPLALVLIASVSSIAAAGPKEDAYGAVERWSKALNEGTADDTAATYSRDASLWGTVATGLTTSPEAFKKYFSAGAGIVKVKLGEHTALQLSDAVVVDAGQYEFSRTRDGQTVTSPARLLSWGSKQGDKSNIVHHHSSFMPKPRAVTVCAHARYHESCGFICPSSGSSLA